MNRKFKFNDCVFKDLDDDNFIYYLGFLWADGHNTSEKGKYNTRIEITNDDFENIKHIFDGINDIEFSYLNRQRENMKLQTYIGVNRKPFSIFLRKNDFNCNSHKSPSKILNKIPDNKKKFFFRGLIDGDGCFYLSSDKKIKQFSISSTIDQDWSYISNLFRKLNIDRYKIIKNKGDRGSHSQIRICNIHDIKKLCDYLYDDISDKIFLERKYNKYIKMLESSDLSIRRKRYNINIEKMVSLKQEGFSVKEISKYFNCPERTIYRRFSKI